MCGQWTVSAFIVAGTLLPLARILLNGALLLCQVAVIVLLAQSWLIRALYVKIPHTSPWESASAA